MAVTADLRRVGPTPRGPAADHRPGDLHRRRAASRACSTRRSFAAPTPTRRIRSIDVVEGQERARRRGRLHRRRPQGQSGRHRAVRLDRAQLRPQDPTAPAARIDRCATWAMALPWSSPPSRDTARDALDLIEVDYEALPAVVDVEKPPRAGRAAAPRRVRRQRRLPLEVAGGDVDAAFKDAERRGEAAASCSSGSSRPRWRRAARSRSWNRGTEELTVWLTTQNPHIHRVLHARRSLELPEHQVRVIAPEVGGGFGSKTQRLRRRGAGAFASMQLGRPVKWIEDAPRELRGHHHGRDQVQYVELCGTKDGHDHRRCACTIYADLGAYLHLDRRRPGVPTILFGLIHWARYTIPTVSLARRSACSPTRCRPTPTAARAARGRPSCRADGGHVAARDRDGPGRGAAEEPHPQGQVPLHDADRPDATTAATTRGARPRRSRWSATTSSARSRRQLRKQGSYLGIGVLDLRRDLRPRPVRRGRRGRLQAAAGRAPRCASIPTGKVTVLHRRLAARAGGGDHLRADRGRRARRPIEDVEVVARRHRAIAACGMGHLRQPRARRSAAPRSCMAPEKVNEKAQEDRRPHARSSPRTTSSSRTARFSVKGAPTSAARRSRRWRSTAYLAWSLPARHRAGPRGDALLRPDQLHLSRSAPTSPSSRSTPETGQVKFLRYVAVDDCGTSINPMIVDGQVHGGIAQGIGQALLEEARLRRGRPAPHRHADGLRRAAGRRCCRLRARPARSRRRR